MKHVLVALFLVAGACSPSNVDSTSDGGAPDLSTRVWPSEDPGDRVCNSDRWCWDNPRPQGNFITDWWGAAADDVWAVGDAGSILHWDGAKWSLARSNPDEVMAGVWGSSATDVWAVGSALRRSITGMYYFECLIHHFDGVTWRLEERLRDASEYGYAIWGSGANDVWIAGTERIVHWDGRGWMEQPALAKDGLGNLWGSGPNDVYLTARDGAFHYDGAGWTKIERSFDVIHFVHGTAANDVWLVQDGRLDHWDGVSWQEIPIPIANEPSLGIVGAWGSRPNDSFFAFSQRGDSTRVIHWDGSTLKEIGQVSSVAVEGILSVAGVVLGTDHLGAVSQWDGSRWSRITQPPVYPAADLQRAWGTSKRDLWAVGSAGEFTHAVVMRWDGTTWRANDPAPAAVVLRDIFGTSSRDVWATETYNVWHWNGTEWSFTEIDRLRSPRGVWAAAPDDVWVVGEGGYVWHFDGTGWTPQQIAYGRTLLSVFGASADRIWAVGEGGVIYGWNGTSWTRQDRGDDSSTLTQVRGSGPDDVWAVGGHAIRHFDGKTGWSTTQVEETLQSVYAVAPDHVWVGADDGLLLHFNGDGWSRTQLPTIESIRGVWWSEGNVWAFGERGSIFRRFP